MRTIIVDRNGKLIYEINGRLTFDSEMVIGDEWTSDNGYRNGQFTLEKNGQWTL